MFGSVGDPTTSTSLAPSTTLVPPCFRDADVSWVTMASVLVLGMFPGLAFFEAGLLRRKNTTSILAQVFFGLAVQTVMWFICGFSLTFGPDAGGAGFIGNLDYGLFLNVNIANCHAGSSIPTSLFALFQLMFAAITPLLITGSIAERMTFKSFIPFVLLWEFFVYYPIAHWIFDPHGWLARLGAQDFAGGIVIHTTAGAASLVAVFLLGRRAGYDKHGGHFPYSSLPLACIGATLLWTGWFGFNGGSALGANSVAVAAVMNSQIAAATCSVVFTALTTWRDPAHRVSLIAIINGAVAGLAGITPASGYVSPLSAFILGILLALAAWGSVWLLKHKLHLDDALEVSAVHGIPGVVGALFIGFAGQRSINSAGADGLFIRGGGSGKLLGVQILAILITLIWTVFWTVAILKLLAKLLGGIRVSDEHEQRGLAVAEHGEAPEIIDSFNISQWSQRRRGGRRHHGKNRHGDEAEEEGEANGGVVGDTSSTQEQPEEDDVEETDDFDDGGGYGTRGGVIPHHGNIRTGGGSGTTAEGHGGAVHVQTTAQDEPLLPRRQQQQATAMVTPTT